MRYIGVVRKVDCGPHTCIDPDTFNMCQYVGSRRHQGNSIPVCKLFDVDLVSDDQRHDGFIQRNPMCIDAELEDDKG